jgi:hypothetical protein
MNRDFLKFCRLIIVLCVAGYAVLWLGGHVLLWIFNK